MSSPDTARQARDGSPPGSGASDRDILGWIIQLYRIVLGRNPDSGGLQAHYDMLRHGAVLNELARVFLDSAEFKARLLDDHIGLFDLYAAAYGAEAAMRVEHRHRQSLTPIAGMPARLAALIRLEPFQPGGSGTAAYVPNDEAGYRLWIAWTEGGVAAESAGARGERLSVSAIVFADGGPDRLLQTVASVCNHGGADVELLVVGWPSPGEWWTLLTARSAGVRVRPVICWPSSTLAGRLTRALRASRGAYVGLIAAGDRLHPQAFRSLTPAINGPEPPEIVFGDEDIAGADGVRRQPWFKTDWDAEAGQALDQIGRAWFARKELMRRAAEAATPQASDWTGELQRRAVDLAGSGPIIHLPSVLQHRRERPAPPWPKPVARPAPSAWPTVSIIVPTRDRADLLQTCVAGLLEQTDYPSLELIIVDNDSREPVTREVLASMAADPRVRLLAYPGEFNWGAINNLAAATATGEVILLLNNDIQVFEPGWLRALVVQALRPEIGVVGATLLYPDRTIQHAGIAFGPDGASGHIGRGLPADAPGPGGRFQVVRSASAVTGACMALRRDVYHRLGGVEAACLRVTWSDSDLCLKAWAAGLRVIVTPFARLVHVELATRGSELNAAANARYEAERAWMRQRWGARLDADPFHSPHLDAETGDLRLADPKPGAG